MQLGLISHFRSTGYLNLIDRVDEYYINEIKSLIHHYINNKINPYRVNNYGEICRIDQLIDRNPIFLNLLREKFILYLLKNLLGNNIEIAKYRHNHATLNRMNDIPYRLHRDIQQWTRSIVTMIIYLEDANVENGCTHIIPSSQYLPFLGHQSENGGGNWADEHNEYELLINQALPIPMKKGEILLLDSLAFHSVGINSTSNTRMSITFAFHSVDDLSSINDDQSKILLCGERIYKGTNNLFTSGSLRIGDEDLLK